MKKFGLIGLALAVPSGLCAVGSADAADMSALSVTPAQAQAKDPTCKHYVDPYKNFACLDKYLGDDPWERFFNYYKLEWGHDAAPADATAPSTFRPDWKQSFPQSTPPMPFTEWPYGGSELVGENRPASVDSPLMVAIAHTGLGKFMSDWHMQMYGWVDPGANLSTNTVRPGGNAPAAYSYTPNTAQLDQAVIYLERTPDETQLEHLDWGFRVSAIYGENYRYTTAYGLSSYQLLNHNLVNGYDFPMMYGEVYVPFLAGLNIRFGRYISIPDIEAQLAPNNYMYSHSMTYTFDNYTNTGLQLTQALNKNWMLQLGVSVGTEAMPWHMGTTIANPFPNPIFNGVTMPQDPGAVPSVAAGFRYQTDSGNDNVYVVADGYNGGYWGYNNLQWLGVTWYHKFDEYWHLSFESYWVHQNNVLNTTDPGGIIANGGFPFSVAQIPFNAPGQAVCSDPAALTCRADSFAALAYLNYRYDGLNNFSYRIEYFDDAEGQRTGVKTAYIETGIGWQHWLSPQIEFRPEVSYYYSLNAPAFNGNFNAAPIILPTKNYAVIAESDVIIHF
jgi:hypothetical protein